MNKLDNKTGFKEMIKIVFFILALSVYAPIPVYSQDTNLESVNDALTQQTANIIETGRIISNIIVVIAFVLLMLNIAFKVMDNSKATAVFIFIIVLRGLYEVIF